MIPYTVNLSLNDRETILMALRESISVAKNDESFTEHQIDLCKKAYTLLGEYSISGGFENEQERSAAYIKSVAEDCQINGCD